MTVRVLVGDCREKLAEIEAGSVQACITSPPFFGLRAYLPAGHPDKAREIGTEATPAEYVAHLVEVFAGVHRVLREDGCLWVELGDSYGHGSTSARQPSRTSSKVSLQQHDAQGGRHGGTAKQLLGIPWRVAFALQDWGWYLRSEIIWHKPNPMPESVQDRPTRSHEYIFLLAKHDRYFYDAAAIAEESVQPDRVRADRIGGANGHTVRHSPGGLYVQGNKQDALGKRTYTGFNGRWDAAPTTTRNKRTVWTVATHPYAAAHFATFPPALIEPCVLAGTSARGCCPQCGAPWRRVVERVRLMPAAPSGNRETGRWDAEQQSNLGGRTAAQDRGWEPTCTCGREDVVPCTVLDCFGGSGTTARVATKHGRDAILVELNPAYISLADDRTAGVQMSMESVL